MAGIPIHTASPINAASAAQEHTAATSTVPPSAAPNPTTPAAQPAATTTATTTASLPSSAAAAAPSALPAQPASHNYAPLPTGPSTLQPPSAAAVPTQSYAPAPTPTTAELPPPPQPGTLPAPYASMSRSPSPRRDIPPPPKAGEKVQPASYYSPAPTPTYQPALASAYAPSPQGMPTVSDPRYGAQYPAATGTTPANNALLSPGGTHPPYGPTAPSPDRGPPPRLSLEHPTGYQQNPYAQDMTPGQRFGAGAGSSSSPSLGYHQHHPSGAQGPPASSSSPGVLGSLASGWGNLSLGLAGLQSPGAERKGSASGGILNGEGGGDGSSVWETVGGWAKTVGKKAADAEAEVWRRVNGE